VIELKIPPLRRTVLTLLLSVSSLKTENPESHPPPPVSPKKPGNIARGVIRVVIELIIPVYDIKFLRDETLDRHPACQNHAAPFLLP